MGMFDFLDKIGLKTVLEAIKGKMPTSLPANGGNADTVDGLHADDFVSAAALNQIQIPSNVDVPAWIYANGKRYQRYMTNDTNIGTTNIPNNSIDWVWYWFDGVNIIAREWATGRYYICDTINGGFSGWKDVYTSGYKPYVTGVVPFKVEPSADDTGCFTHHGFMPSAVLYWSLESSHKYYNHVLRALSFNENKFDIDENYDLPSDGSRYGYIIFK